MFYYEFDDAGNWFVRRENGTVASGKFNTFLELFENFDPEEKSQ